MVDPVSSTPRSASSAPAEYSSQPELEPTSPPSEGLDTSSLRQAAPEKSSSSWSFGGILDSIGDGLSAAANRVMDIGHSAFEAVGHIGSTLIGGAEGAWDVAKGIGNIFTGDFSEGTKEVGQGLLNIGGSFVDGALSVGGKFVSGLQTLFGFEQPGRKLTTEERDTLQKVYGDSINYDRVRIKEGDAGVFMASGERQLAHGNTIYMKNLKPGSKRYMNTLVHEMGHVWQNQNGGVDYMRKALTDQMLSGADAYAWEDGLKTGKSWSELGPEQQAELIAVAYNMGYFEPSGTSYGFPKGSAEDNYIRAAIAEMRAGRGAP